MIFDGKSQRVSVKELALLIGRSYSTARREKAVILELLEIRDRKYLIVSDLVSVGIL